MEVLMLIDIILRIILIVVALRFNSILDRFIKNQEDKTKVKEFKRVHNSISQSNFANILNGRTNVYDKYKNESGLYEPVQGKNGINLNKDKGE